MIASNSRADTSPSRKFCIFLVLCALPRWNDSMELLPGRNPIQMVDRMGIKWPIFRFHGIGGSDARTVCSFFMLAIENPESMESVLFGDPVAIGDTFTIFVFHGTGPPQFRSVDEFVLTSS